MKTITHSFNRRAVRILGALLTLVVVLGTIAFTLSAPKAQAQAMTSHGVVHGYAWSSTIGWVSLNCAEGSSTGGSVCATSNYGVVLNAGTGAYASADIFSGYAWSSNVGWISFNSADASTCGTASDPGGPGILSGGRVVGWAKIVSGTTASGADGCINLGPAGVPPYGLAYSTTSTVSLGSTALPGYALSGYTWGDVNTGWLNFDYSTIDFSSTATVQLYASSGSTLYSDTTPLALTSSGGTFDLVWQSTGMASCSATATPASSAWTGSKPVQNPTTWTNATTDTSYPVTVPANTGTSVQTYTYAIACSPTSGSPVTDTVTVTVAAPAAPHSVSLLVNGSTSYTMPMASGGPVTLSWTSSGVTSCTASATPTSTGWTGTKATSGSGTSVTVPANTSTTTTMTQTYTMSCTSSPNTYTSTVTVTIPPTGICSVSPSDQTVTTTAGGTVSSTLPFTINGDFTGNTDISLQPSSPMGDNDLTYTVTTPSGAALPTEYNAYIGATLPILGTNTPAVLHITGPVPAADDGDDLVIDPVHPGGGNFCDQGTVEVMPPDTTSGGGTTTGAGKPIWEEF